jgi:hypothetical protein
VTATAPAPRRRSGFASPPEGEGRGSFTGLIGLAPPPAEEQPDSDAHDQQSDDTGTADTAATDTATEDTSPEQEAANSTTEPANEDTTKTTQNRAATVKKFPTPAPEPEPDAATSSDENPWQITLPLDVKPRAGKKAFDDLLSGPVETVPMVLPAPIAEALQQYSLQLAIAGTPVTQQALVAHALAYAYAHQHDWLHTVPADGRRSGAMKHLTHGARKTTFRLPSKLHKATLLILLTTLPNRKSNAASRISLTSTALAFALNHADQWIADATSTTTAHHTT